MIDVSQFHATFLEESSEHLVDLEAGLLELEQQGSTDMNAIFRAAHSIKGGAATFGFDAIADFTHVVESVLEKARDGEIDVTEELTTLLLGSLDIISELVDAAKEGRDASVENRETCLEGLNSYLDGKATGTSDSKTAVEAEPAEAAVQERVMNLTLKPKTHFPQTGSEMINILRELSTLGDMEVTCYPDLVPHVDEIEAEDMYLWWEVELITCSPDEEIQDVFMFVEDDMEIKIETIAAFDHEHSSVGALDIPVTATPMPERRQDERRSSADRREGSPQRKESASIRVSIDKVDSLINLVGELITTQAMVEQHSSKLKGDENNIFASAMNELVSHTRNLQEEIMGIRMMPIDFAFSRFPRMVRDTANKLGKKVHLETSGAQTELDKTVIEKIADPLTHLVRNSVDHGIELPSVRVDNNKDEEGIIHLAAYYRGGNVIIEIRDDGAGLNREKILAKAVEKGLFSADTAQNMPDEDVWQLIFDSGFSTAAEVTDVSGRGVGMDVVRKNIQELGGSIQIESTRGVGTSFIISLPLTLAIVDGMATRVGNETYILPILNLIESIRVTEDQVKSLQDGVEVVDVRGDYIPLMRLSEVFPVHNQAEATNILDGIVVIVESDQNKIALFIDELLGERQVVIKSVEDNYKAIEGISGATILGDGSVALIVDLSGLVKLARREGRFMKIPKQIKTQKAQEAIR